MKVLETAEGKNFEFVLYYVKNVPVWSNKDNGKEIAEILTFRLH